MGCLSVRMVAEALNRAEPPTAIAELVESPPTVRRSDTVDNIFAALDGAGGTGVPVVTENGDAVIGWITHEIVLTRMRSTTSVRRSETR